MTQLTLEDAIRFVDEAVASKPEGYIYINPDGQQAYKTEGGSAGTVCSYWDVSKNEPSCLVGHVLHRMGPENDLWKEAGSTFGGVSLAIGREKFADGVVSFLRDIQELQDIGTPWSAAVAEAKARL